MAEINKIEKDKDSFTVNDLVLCYEPDPHKARVLYEAKIIDIDQTKDDQGKLVSEFYVHFQGWNKSWDRWVLEDQILTINENSRELQSQLFKKAVQLRKRKPKRSEDDKSSEDEGKVKKEAEKVFDIPLVSLDIPKILATHLEDDCYCIQRKKKLVLLPRKPCVTQILNDYLKQCMENPKSFDGRYLSFKIIGEVMEGLNTYFNFFISTLLLYNFEREQYLTYFPNQDNFDEKMSQKDGLNTALFKRTDRSNELENNKPSTSSSSKVLDQAVSTKKERRAETKKKEKEERRKSSREKKPINILQSGVSKSKVQPQLACDGKNIVEIVKSEREKKSNDSTSLNRSRRKFNLCTVSVTDSESQCTGENSKNIHRPRAKLSGCEDDVSTNDITKGNHFNDISIPTKTDVHFRRSTRGRKSSEEATENICYSQKSVNNDVKAKMKKVSDTEGFFMAYPLMPNGDSPADIYGVEHFLRLFVKLPVLLAVANIEEEKINIFLKCVSNLLEYLSKRKDLFSMDVYSDAIV